MAVYRALYTHIRVAPSSAFPSGVTQLVPFLHPKLINGSNHIRCYAVVDSGASCCCFPRAFLTQLGISPLGLPSDTALGVRGVGTRLFHDITIDLGLSGFAPFRVYAGFAAHLDDLGTGILGQMGFFDRFKLRFDVQRGVFEIES